MEPGRRAVVPADHEQLSAAGGGGLALKLVYEELHRRLIHRQVLHADETTLQVLKLEGRTARSKCYMGDAKYPIVLYLPRRRRTRLPFWRVSPGDSDGCADYHRLPENIRAVGCWAYLHGECPAEGPTRRLCGTGGAG